MKQFLKQYSYQFLGYSGVLPFALFCYGAYAFSFHPVVGEYSLMMQMGYASMILSFLSALYWQKSVIHQKFWAQVTCLMPIILLLPIFYWGVLYDKGQSILMMIPLFWAVFVMDKIMGKNDGWPKGYYLYRFNLTSLVTICLFLSYWVSL
ncbi:MAG: DUF3429 domain-containing protein [Pseudomonadota bacterium]